MLYVVYMLHVPCVLYVPYELCLFHVPVVLYVMRALHARYARYDLYVLYVLYVRSAHWRGVGGMCYCIWYGVLRIFYFQTYTIIAELLSAH